ncbi:hypothetical protein M0R72_09410 [Candidatus Pacearchaeota archaeon]|nr:hypothetical protein [Candidatus Pacearchaeota archaeon]
MIIQIRGTSGSGKSTAMRKVMHQLSGKWCAVRIPGRQKPLYYHHDDIAILGHYDSPCGGGDTIGSARAIYDLIQELTTKPCFLCQKRFHTILVEGLLLSEDVKWSSQLENLRVVFLVTPLDQCLEWISNRRKSVGNEKPLNPANTTNRVAVIERARQKLVQLGIHCCRASARQTPRLIQSWIKEYHA